MSNATCHVTPHVTASTPCVCLFILALCQGTIHAPLLGCQSTAQLCVCYAHMDTKVCKAVNRLAVSSAATLGIPLAKHLRDTKPLGVVSVQFLVEVESWLLQEPTAWPPIPLP